MQDRPICFYCGEQVDHSPVFEAPCGHDAHSSAVFHGLCLMKFREFRDERSRVLQKWLEEHAEHDQDYEQ